MRCLLACTLWGEINVCEFRMSDEKFALKILKIDEIFCGRIKIDLQTKVISLVCFSFVKKIYKYTRLGLISFTFSSHQICIFMKFFHKNTLILYIFIGFFLSSKSFMIVNLYILLC